ncbi:oxidoreductase [Nakamurella antarctica]|uniref:Oxidoreductase n=1 Tax=Nakamurella antarctica TaxID=1902245 RepID=A0A3G8ZXC7_9ACTN|nr:molybdopterin-dependent oxidoreductase [Nakamurella antarctica]AZI59074.1 oxidoreductase [Nakamurella antarctica]
MTIPTQAQPTAEAASGAPSRIGRIAAALVGLAVVAAAVGLAELVAAIGSYFNAVTSATSASPLNGLGATFIQFTPEWLKQFAIAQFGTNDKVALRVGMGITLIILAAVIGVIARSKPLIAQALFVVLGVVTVIAILTRTGAGPADAIPTILGIAAGVVLLRKVLSPDKDATVAADTGPNRRRFVQLATGSAGLAVASGVLSRVIPTSAAAEASRKSAAAETASIGGASLDKMKALPAGYQLDNAGVVSFVTPNTDFYRIDTAITVPRLDANTWELKITGMVENPITITYKDLLDRPLIERMITLTCVSNEIGGELVGNAKWQGARLADILAEAKPMAGADMVMSRSSDGMEIGSPLAVLLEKDRDAILAVTMNDEVLPFEHGFPVRMVVPGLYGYVSATKWVVELEVTKYSDQKAYWTNRGWGEMGPIKTANRIDTPKSFQKLPAGKFAIGGIAWHQHLGISKVEVQIDGGEWMEAKISTEVTIDTWRQWSYVWDATPGQHTIKSRATDSKGEVQTESVAGVLPDGATGYDSRFVTVT